MPTSSPPRTLSSNKQAIALLTKILRRAYGQIDEFIVLGNPAPGQFEGVFRDGQKLLKLEVDLEKDEFNYQQLQRDRRDSVLADYLAAQHPELNPAEAEQPEYILSYLSTRLDAKRRKARCEKGVECGKICISPNKTCKLKAGSVMTGGERKALMAASPQSGEKSDPYSGKSIRELQQIARDRQVYRANHQSKVELINTLNQLDQDPEKENRLRKTLEKRQATKRTAQRVTGDYGKAWRQIESISRIFGHRPEQAAILAAAALGGFGVRQFNQVRGRYKSGLQDSAKTAFQRAANIPTDLTDKPNILFAVGGFSSTGSLGARMRKSLETPADKTPGEEWFGQENHIVAFNHPEFDIPASPVSKKKSDGSYNPQYLAHVATNSFGKYLQNLKRGRNDAAVDLATQMYAYGARYRQNKLNVLAHGAGGNVAREAVEILKRIKDPDGNFPSGDSMLRRMNIVNLGSASFGFTNDAFWKRINFQTLTSGEDPFSILPKAVARWIPSVPGHEIQDYLGDSEVRDRLRESFSYYSSSLRGQVQAQSEQRETTKKVSKRFPSFLGASAGKAWEGLLKARDIAATDPIAASVKGGATLLGMSEADYADSRKRYQANFAESAKEAYEIAQNTAVKNVRNTAVTLAIGGTGATGARVAEKLQQDPFFGRKNRVEAFELSGIEPNLPEGVNPDTTQGAMYATFGGFGRSLRRNLSLGKNEDAIRLAAQIYAYGDKEMKQGTVQARIPINVVGYDVGGQVAREALQILKLMGPSSRQGRPLGSLMSNRVRIATLGTPRFGVTQNISQEAQSFMTETDPLSQLPFQDGGGIPVEVSGGKGHSLESYLDNETARLRLANFFKSDLTNRRSITRRRRQSQSSQSQG
ncbi:MAG: hypothetical protein QNJ46_09570 [Leptolyngbyaceae cyanobacterium MO_188.B28]|nr:hypothetical protein [Leptolyngbyaceae cyanobacterium MO_188.B28]